MSFSIVNAPQRSPEWFAARAGRLTGSMAGDMLATIKSGEAAARRDYRLQLALERLTGNIEQMKPNEYMQWGIDCEPEARAAYESRTGVLVRETGFLSHDTELAGCSLDGDIDDFTGILEIKCPKSATHIEYLRGGKLPSKYAPQVTHNLWVTGAEWCDFVSYDPRLPAGLDFFMVRVYARDLDFDGYEEKALAFLAEVDALTSELEMMINNNENEVKA